MGSNLAKNAPKMSYFQTTANFKTPFFEENCSFLELTACRCILSQSYHPFPTRIHFQVSKKQSLYPTKLSLASGTSSNTNCTQMFLFNYTPIILINSPFTGLEQLTAYMSGLGIPTTSSDRSSYSGGPPGNHIRPSYSLLLTWKPTNGPNSYNNT